MSIQGNAEVDIHRPNRHTHTDTQTQLISSSVAPEDMIEKLRVLGSTVSSPLRGAFKAMFSGPNAACTQQGALLGNTGPCELAPFRSMLFGVCVCVCVRVERQWKDV